ncbi:MAG: GP88 family protein, partial [bacterium]
MKLLTVGNPKLMKGEKKGFLSFVLHLAPADLSGKEVCPKRTAGCTAACLNTAGRGGIFKKGESTNVIQQARIRRTKMFFESRDQFLADLTAEIKAGVKMAEKKGLTAVFRLNGTSDISWEKYGIIEQFPDVQFYDYTKVRGRKVSHLPNYHLTFSRADGNEMDARLAASAGMNVAVVFKKELPATYFGKTVVNGDETDLRFLDPRGVIVGLKAKG